MTKIPPSIANILQKPVAVLGNGVTGKALSELLTELQVDYTVYDEKNKECSLFDIKAAQKHALVLYSPGFSQTHPWVKTALENNCVCMGELDFVAHFWQGRIVAVTGTNGKTTLTEFLAFALSRLGKVAIAVGNNGQPLSKFSNLFTDKDAVAVCETSSFQSEHLIHFRPDDLLWTNFDADHLDRHQTVEKYFDAKWKLVERVDKGITIFGESVAEWAKKLGKALPENITIAKMNFNIPQGTVFEKYPQLENFAIARAYWIHKGYDITILEEAAKLFTLPRHRLQKVVEVGGIRFWNDSKATNFHATKAALAGFEKQVVWIGGGAGKGLDTKELIDSIFNKLKYSFLIGIESDKLRKNIEQKGGLCLICKTLEEAIEKAYLYSKQHLGNEADIVFSPGFTSYDMFDNYAHRGNCYEEIVLRLKDHLKAHIPE